eukprot:gnl/Ergobibamus_cyprinoides/462.p1 GENE.gnl/Ergobibamus_cyprinoides/462~~gnl/Ergobibamus_cyprinoides/462.p1  ORF type:complete len:241 (+),score=81.16 gnl/Ergobibamus_cyprinoides/462:59-724(+)
MAFIAFNASIVIFYALVYHCYRLFGYMPDYLSSFGHTDGTSTFYNAGIVLVGLAMTFVSFFYTPVFIIKAYRPKYNLAQRIGFFAMAAVHPFVGLGISASGVFTGDFGEPHHQALAVTMVFVGIILLLGIALAETLRRRIAYVAYTAAVLFCSSLPGSGRAFGELCLAPTFYLFFTITYLVFIRDEVPAITGAGHAQMQPTVKQMLPIGDDSQLLGAADIV